MSSEILSVLEYMEKEKGISRADMIAAIVNALKTAALKGVNSGQELKIDINPKNGQLKAWSLLKVVDSISNPKVEVHIEKAQVLRPGAQLGEFIEKEIDPSTLGRIAAQTARQAVMQRLRQFEKDRIYDDFKDQVGNIVTGTVRRRERNDIYVDLGKAEAVMPAREQVPGEEYQPGDRIRSLLLEIENTPRGPEIILTRASSKFVRRLFELEVTEIADSTVKIEAFAREPGYRTKIAVTSADPKVEELRNRQVKNFLTVTMLSFGLPMISMGDEVRRTQRGNNNAYCQDNEISWFDWALVGKHADVHRFVKYLGALRLMRGLDREFQTSTLNELLRAANGVWHGVKLEQPDWHVDSHSVAYSAARADGSLLFYAIFTAYWEVLEFELPPTTPEAPWRRWIDTSLESPQDIVDWKSAALVTTRTYRAGPRSVVVLRTHE